MINKKEVKVAFLNNSIDTSIYNPEEHWKPYLEAELENGWDSFKATKSHFPDLENGYTHLLLTGSESSILERENWVYEEVELIQEAVERGLSILGSCYGHQLLVFALLGPSAVRRSIQPEVGWIPIQIKERSEFLGEKRQAFSFSVHFDEVVNLSETFLVLASSRECPVQAFQLKGRPIWGIQIHPEINISNAQKLLKNLIGLELNTTPVFEKALKSDPKDSGLIHGIVKNFLKPRE
ncbi:MAG: gamma-glutamyl-gamma-aminobutyrate hydrolase family protein [Candidatus Aminicenantaceae bacterium]